MNHSQLRIAQTCYEDITYLSRERYNKNLILSSEKWFITENKPQTTLLESKKMCTPISYSYRHEAG